MPVILSASIDVPSTTLAQEARSLPSPKPGSLGRKNVNILVEESDTWQRFGQLVKIGISIILTLGFIFLSHTLYRHVQAWWNEYRTGKRVVEKWSTNPMPSDAYLTHKISLGTLGKPEDKLTQLA